MELNDPEDSLQLKIVVNFYDLLQLDIVATCFWVLKFKYNSTNTKLIWNGFKHSVWEATEDISL